MSESSRARFDVVLDGALFGREGEEQLVKTADVFACLRRTVLREVLREGEHQRLAAVEYIDLLALFLGEAVRTPDGEDRHQSTQRDEDDTEQAYLPERRFDIFQ